jgi:hypothetical protein
VGGFLFFLNFLIDSSQTDNHHQKDLAKFGYRPDINANEFKNRYIFQLPAGKCCKKLWRFE